jgi:Ser-tRNA(Ala) deacylase AlaX
LADAETIELERRINEIIKADLPVTEAFITKAEAQRDFNLDRLPEGAGDTIRIISIGNYDACPCIGPHVKSTKAIGGFRVISTSFDDGILRIRFKLAKTSLEARR